MSLVLGYSTARFILTDDNGRLTTYNIPLTNLAGRQIETYAPDGYEDTQVDFEIEESRITRSLLQKVRGIWITWTFSYQNFIEGDDVVTFGQIIEGVINGGTLELIPRIDEQWRKFQVVLVMNEFALGISTGASLDSFNKDFVIQFKTKNMEKSLKWQLVEEEPVRAILLDNCAFTA